MADPVPIVLHHTPSDTNTPSLLYAGEAAVAHGPTHTKLWVGDGTTNRLLLSTNAADSPLIGGAGGGPDLSGGSQYQVLTNTGTGFAWQDANARPNSSTAGGTGALALNTANNNTAFGLNALSSNVASTANTAVGTNALRLSTSANNTAVGFNALSATVGGGGNTALGRNAGQLNAGGVGNTALGDQSLTLNVGTWYNVAVGQNTLYNLTGGGSNVAIGRSAMIGTTSSNYSVAIGSAALSAAGVCGDYNVAIGYQALQTSAGQGAGGGRNVAVGYVALGATTNTSWDVAVGTQALATKVTGNNNTAVGGFAGNLYGAITSQHVTDTANSVFVGYQASALAASGGTNEIVIGYQATGNGSNTVTLGNAAITQLWCGGRDLLAAAGVPTGGTQYQALIKGAVTAFGWDDIGARPNEGLALGAYDPLNPAASTGYGNIAFGNGTLSANTTGATNTVVGDWAMQRNTTGNNNVAVGASALTMGVASSNTTAVGFGALQGHNTLGMTATNSVAVGHTAGTSFGTGAGTLLSTVSNSIFIGNDARASANGNSNEIVIGQAGRGNGSNTVTLGNASTTQLWCGGRELLNGVTDGSNAAAGQVGEFFETSAFVDNNANGSFVNVCSLALTAGDWDVVGNASVSFTGASAPTGNSDMRIGMGTASQLGTLTWSDAQFATWPALGAIATVVPEGWVGSIFGSPVGPQRVNLTASDTIYVRMVVWITGGDTMRYWAAIRARRVR